MKEGLSLRDRALLTILGIVVLYVAAGFIWFLSVRQKWTASLKKYRTAVTKYEQENALIAESDHWNMQYLNEREKMPMFPEEEDVDTHWMNLMDSLATSNYVSITRRQYGKEEAKGDVFELPVEVSGWEGSLEGLVSFLWALQSDERAMMDVSSISIRPSQKKGFFKGSFTLMCAYMRGNPAKADAKSAGAPGAGGADEEEDGDMEDGDGEESAAGDGPEDADGAAPAENDAAEAAEEEKETAGTAAEE